MSPQWREWATRRVGETLAREGLHVSFRACVEGPLVVTFVLGLRSPRRADIDRALSLSPALSHALGVRGVRIAQGDDGSLLIELPSPAPRTPTAEELARHTRGPVVAVGLDSFRRPVFVDLRAAPSVLFVGPTRSGKTEAARAALYGLAQEGLRFVVCAPKVFRWSDYAAAAGCLGIAPTEEALAVGAWLSETLRRRVTQGQRSPGIVVVWDDLHAILADVPGLVEHLARVASTGGEVGLFQLLISQDAGSRGSVGGPMVEANTTARIVYRSSSATHAARASGRGGTGVDELTGQPGDALLLLGGASYRVATGYTSPDLGRRLAVGPQLRPPWRQLSEELAQPPATVRSGTARPYNRPTTATTAPTAPVAPPVPQAPEPGRGGEASPTVAPVGAVVDMPGPGAERVAWIRDTSGGVFPIGERRRLIIGEETAHVRRVRALGASWKDIAGAVYGYQDGQVFAWLKESAAGLELDPQAGLRRVK